MATAFAGAGAQIWNTTAFGGAAKTTTLAGATANDLLVVVVAASGYSGTWTVTDDNSSGTYTDVTGVINENAGTDTMRVFVRNSLVPATASTIISASGPTADTGGGFAVYRLTGMSRTGSAAVRQFKVTNNGISSATPSATFASAALTGNSILGAVIIELNPAGLTPPSSPAMTEKHDLGYATPATGLEVCTLDSGFTGTVITWGSISGATFGCVIVEMDSSAAPAAPVKALGLLGVG